MGDYRCQHPIHPHLMAICMPSGEGEVQANHGSFNGISDVHVE